eukprot:8771426-Lingulodinium_polyedra.AAC.1
MASQISFARDAEEAANWLMPVEEDTAVVQHVAKHDLPPNQGNQEAPSNSAESFAREFVGQTPLQKT